MVIWVYNKDWLKYQTIIFFLAILGPVRLLSISMYWKNLRETVVGFFIPSVFDLVLNAAGVIQTITDLPLSTIIITRILSLL